MSNVNVSNSRATTASEGVPATLPEGSLRELINARVVTGFMARGNKGGFVIEAILGSEPERLAMLGNSRGGPRVFASLGTIAVLLQKFGFMRFVVDSTHYVPGRVRAARPDRSAAMRAAGRPVNAEKTPKASKPTKTK